MSALAAGAWGPLGPEVWRDPRAWAALVALLAAALTLVGQGRSGWALAPRLVVLAPLAAWVALGVAATPVWIGMLAALVVAVLARDRGVLASECALKLLWVTGGALALSLAGLELLVVATGTSEPMEQWAVLGIGVDPPHLWSTALPLSVLAGVVLLGGAPFHFWAADLFHGTPAWLAPLAVAALQIAGAGWLDARLEGIETFPEAARSLNALLTIATLAAFAIGAVTLLGQRQPERRIGTLASLNGAVALAGIAVTHSERPFGAGGAVEVGVWASHLCVALAGAGLMSRFLPIAPARPEPPPALFRHHPWAGAAGLFAMASLAGVPGTPGGQLWLGLARDLAGAGRTWLLAALGLAWLAGFSVVVRQVREAYGAEASTLGYAPVARSVRLALWLAAAALVAFGVAMARR